MQKIKNYCIFHIKGLNQERFFNELSKEFQVFDINRYEKNKTTFKVPLKNFKAVKNKILSSGFEIIGQSKFGFLHKIFSLKKRYGLVVGVLLFAILYIFQYGFVLQIKIEGVEVNLQNEISNYISQNFSMRKSEVNGKDIEIAIKEEFKELSFASVAVVGQSLVINVKESENPVEKAGEFDAIVSNYNCKIVSIKLLQGTLAVEKGDVVKKGDVLVYPYVVDSFGEERAVKPKAEITIEEWHQGEEEHYENSLVRERTGKVYVKNELLLFGQIIYVHNSENLFDEFDVESDEKYFSNNNILPFIYKKTTYYEVKYVEKNESYQSVREKKIESAREKALQKSEECDIITNERYEEDYSGGVYKIIYTITTQKEITITWKFTQNQKNFV